jgi:hypothetical protein
MKLQLAPLKGKKAMSNDSKESKPSDALRERNSLKRRDLLLAGTSLAAASAIAATGLTAQAQTQQPVVSPASGKKPNILVLMGDDIGIANVSIYSHGLMGYQTPNIDRIAREGVMFMDYYAEQSSRRGDRRSSQVRRPCAPASPRSAFPESRSDCRRAMRQLPNS